MRHSSFLVVAFCGLLLGASASASEQEFLPLQTFRVESAEITGFGPVIISGTQTSQGIQTFRIEAFGRSVTLQSSDLQKLRGLSANGIQLSHEAGYPQLGGPTISILLSIGFTAGIPQGKIISLTKRGDIDIRDARPR